MATSSLPSPHRWRSPRRSVVVGAALLVVASSYAAGFLLTRQAPAQPAAAAPATRPVPIPDGPPPVVTQSLDRIDQAIRVWSGNLTRDGQDFVSATNLADIYYSRARLTGNLDDYTRAK